jgi:tetratricopeptide (TPR) repeat protein
MPFLPPEALADEASIAEAAARAVTLARRGEARAALNLALQARRQAQSLETVRGELEALNAAATVHLIRGDAVSAVASAIDARDLAQRSGDRSLLGQALVSLQMSAFILGAGDGVHAALRECTREALEHGDVAVEVRARNALGVVLGDGGHFDAAAYEFDRALRLGRGLPPALASAARITANVANLHRKRASAYFAQGFEARGLHECGLAIALAGDACRLAAAEGAVSVEIDALAIRGCAHEQLGEPARARLLLRESIALGRGARCPSAIVWVLSELGRMCLAAGDFGQARAAYAEALDLARELRPSRKIATACLGLSEVAARSGDLKGAAEWRERGAEEAAAFEIASLQTRRQIGDGSGR